MTEPLPTRLPSVMQPRQAYALALSSLNVDPGVFTRNSFNGYRRGQIDGDGVGAIAWQRWKVWSKMREFGLSYPEIARETGTTHSTIIGAVKRYRELVGYKA